jgi:Ca-activated chloride channel family protein
VLVISDGEDHEGEPEKEAKKLLDAGVRTYTVGVGTTKGANIPLEQNGEPKGMMVDREGKLVVTKLNEEILSELAVAGNGTYLHLDNEIVDAKTILANVAQVGQNNYGDVQTQHYASHFMEFMVIAFILLVWDSFFHLGKPRKQ